MSEATVDAGVSAGIMSDDLFDALETDVPADELDVRAHESGFAYVQAPNGNTVEVLAAEGGVMVQAVEAEEVGFEERDELNDVFTGDITCE